MGLFGDLYTLAKEVRDKQSMDKTIQIFRMHKGDEFYWQQLLEFIAQAQHWGLKKEQCLMAGQEKGFEMAAKNEQKFRECLDRIEREVGIDKDELERRIDKALGRDRAKEEQMSLKKTMHIEEAAELLSLLCTSEWADEDSPEPWTLQPLHREVETTQFVERTDFLMETTFFAFFAVDYATAAVLGQHNPTRGTLLDAVRGKFIFSLPKKNPDLCFALSDVLNERLTMYAIAYHFHTKDMQDRVCMIAGAFSKLNEGRTTDPDLTVKAGVHFVAIVDRVKKFLNSVNLVY